MFRRNRKHNKTLPSVHTVHDGQSETDSQSQTSDGAGNASVVYRKAAQVRVRDLLLSLDCIPNTLDQNGRKFYSKIRFWFPFGIIRGFPCFARSFHVQSPVSSVGIALGLVFVEPSTLPDIPGHLSMFLEDYDLSLPLPLLPIDLSRVHAEWNRLISTIPEPWKLNTDGREFQVGDAIKARGLDAEYPVILIPGVISTVLAFSASSPGFGVPMCLFPRALSPGQRRQNIALSSARKYGAVSRCSPR
jgi:hypothetical protein